MASLLKLLLVKQSSGENKWNTLLRTLRQFRGGFGSKRRKQDGAAVPFLSVGLNKESSLVPLCSDTMVMSVIEIG